MNVSNKIHKYDKRFKDYLTGIKEEKFCNCYNKEYILDFQNYLFAGGLTKCRVTKYLRLVSKIDRAMNTEFNEVGKKEVVEFLARLKKSDYNPYTKKDYKIGLKRFFRWMNDGKGLELLTKMKEVVEA